MFTSSLSAKIPGLLVVSLLGLCMSSAEAQQKKPNIVII